MLLFPTQVPAELTKILPSVLSARNGMKRWGDDKKVTALRHGKTLLQKILNKVSGPLL